MLTLDSVAIPLRLLLVPDRIQQVMGSSTLAADNQLASLPDGLQQRMDMDSTGPDKQLNQVGSHAKTNHSDSAPGPAHHHKAEYVWEQIRLPSSLPERERLQGAQNYGSWYPRVLNRLRQMSLAHVALGQARCPGSLTINGDSNCGGNITNRFHLVDQATLGYLNDQLSNEIMSAARTCASSRVLMRHLDQEYGSGNPSLREAIAGQLNAQLDHFQK
jgi:hypothetical protein